MASGFDWPSDVSADFAEFSNAAPGNGAAALFAWQAECLSYSMTVDPLLQEPSLKSPHELALWEALTALASGAEAGDGALAAIRAIEPLVERMREPLDARDLLLAPIELGDEELAEALSWLVASAWALASASSEGRSYIGCFSSNGPVWQRSHSSDTEFDRLLLRCYLNDTPSLQTSEELVPYLPSTADGWILSAEKTLSGLEFLLAQLPAGAERASGMPVPRNDHPLLLTLKDLTLLIAPAQKLPSGYVWLPVLMSTHYGVTLLEVEIRDGVIHELAQPPLGYAGLEFIERIELIRENFERALALALSLAKSLINSPAPKPHALFARQ